MGEKKLRKNTISALIYQVVTIACGFIIPKMILNYYGSEVNGLVNSITQFLSIIAFLELGVGAVVQSTLYKPLAENNYKKQSEIYISAQLFFKNLSKILIVYIVILIIIFPYLTGQKFSFGYTAILIVSMSISSFAQYYFGIVNSLLLSADQMGYIQYRLQTISLIINTVFCIILMANEASIHFIKLTTSVIYLIRPIYLNYYVKRYYKIDKKVKYTTEPIKQKWDGICQHIAAIILDGTDTIILSVFATLKDVSVYSVYYLVVSGIKQMFNTCTGGIQAFLGNLYAKDDLKTLKEKFNFIEWIIHTLTILIMGCTATLITPFVLVYTSNINDANYNQEIFGYIITFAYIFYCLKLPYHMMIKASGKYKETKYNYIISACLNIIVSIIMVKICGLIGVAIGTLIAMIYQTIGLAIYNYKNIIISKYGFFIKQIIVDCFSIIIGILCVKLISVQCFNIVDWIILAFKITLMWCLIIIIMNLVFYSNNVKKIIKKINNKMYVH